MPNWFRRETNVQEPLDQLMRVTVQDVDLFSPRELLTLQLHNTLGSRHVLGRAAVDVADACRAEGEVITRRAPLGAGDWSAAAGPVSLFPHLRLWITGAAAQV